MKRFDVTIEGFNDLSPAEQNLVPQVGKQYASYIRIKYYNETIMLKSDSIEPEDKTFNRDLSWIKGALLDAYASGFSDGYEKRITE
jgi:hypothetical protein